jgi:hypothetical protein
VTLLGARRSAPWARRSALVRAVLFVDATVIALEDENGRQSLPRRPFPETPGFSLPVQLQAELNRAGARAAVICLTVLFGNDAHVCVTSVVPLQSAFTVVHCVWLKALMKSARNCRRLSNG